MSQRSTVFVPARRSSSRPRWLGRSLSTLLLVLAAALPAVMPQAWAAPAEPGASLEMTFPEPLAALVATGPKTYLDVPERPAGEAITVDGDLSEAAWQQAAAIGNFTPDDSPTTARVTFDQHNLYIGIVCTQPAGTSPIFEARQRDTKAYTDDCIELWFAPTEGGTRFSKGTSNDRYQFVISAGNAIWDGIRRGAGGSDTGYDPHWQHAVQQGQGQWTVEVAIPHAALKLSQWRPVLGFNIGRNGPGRKASAWASQYGPTTDTNLRLEGVTQPVAVDDPAEAVMEDAETDDFAEGSLAVDLPRATARPGDRWIDANLALDIAPEALADAKLVVNLFDAMGTEPVETLAITPQRAVARLSVDLRSANLRRGRVTIALEQQGRTTGTAVLNLVAAPLPQTLEAGRQIPVRLDVPEAVRHVAAAPVTFGVPFAAGELWDVSRLGLVDGQGRAIPSQTEITGRWSRDGSIQWVRFDAVVDTAAGVAVQVRPAGAATPVAASAGQSRLTVQEQGDALVVDTGAARYVLGKGASPIRSIERDGRPVASSGDPGLYVIDQDGRVASASADGETMEVEAAGPIEACIRFEGFYRTQDGEPLARHITRVMLHAGKAQAAVTHTLVLSRNTQDVWFREIGWAFDVEAGNNAAALFGVHPQERTEGGGGYRTAALSAAQSAAYMIQTSHYLFKHGQNRYHIATTAPGSKPQVAHEGEEMGDWAALAGSSAGLAIACRDAARQHPKELLVEPGRLVLKLWSDRAGETLNFDAQTLTQRWDLENWDRYDREGQLEAMKQYKSNALGWSKTHELQIDPLSGGAEAADVARQGDLHSTPVYALVDPAWIHHSRAMGPNYPADAARFPEVDAAQRAAVRYWVDADKAWGENGFVDYNAGPHLTYRNGRPIGRRYPHVTYQLRSSLWLAYARHGDRWMREFVTGTNRAQMDNIHAHWSDSGSLIPGLYRSEGGPLFGVPIYWGSRSDTQIAGSTNLNNYIWDYHLNGYRRARDVLEEFAAGLKQWWTPQRAASSWRILQTHRVILQCYGLTWDSDLLTLAHHTADLFEDPEGEIGLSKERPYNSSTYKTMADVRGLIDAWELLGHPRYLRTARRVADFLWSHYVASNGYGYNIPNAVIAQFLYGLTGDVRYAQGIAVTTRAAVSAYDPETGTWRNDSIEGAQSVGYMFEIGYALDLIARTDVDRKPAASWFGWDDSGGATQLIVAKPYDQRVKLEFSTPASATWGESGGDVIPVTVDAVVDGGRWGQDLIQIHQDSSGKGHVLLPKDAPKWEYALRFPHTGKHFVLAGQNVPMVLHAPEYWLPNPTQRPAVRYYFQVPEGVEHGAIFFDGSARLYTPADEPWQQGEPLSGWVEFGGAPAGVWAFEPVDSSLVKVRNLPPFFAVERRDRFFIPEGISWEGDADADLAAIEVPLEQVYAAGATGAADDQSLHLAGSRTLHIAPGPAHPSGDGSQFLPFRQGTIEFWFRPRWNSVDLADGSEIRFVLGRTEGEGRSFTWNYRVLGRDKQFFSMISVDRPNDVPRGVRSLRYQTLFDKGQWVHVAWVWGEHNRTFVNGKLGRQREELPTIPYPVLAPMTSLTLGSSRAEGNLDGFVDQLRISDVARYGENFTPPDRRRRLERDEHTRLLLHFDGTLEGASHGYQGALDVRLDR